MDIIFIACLFAAVIYGLAFYRSETIISLIVLALISLIISLISVPNQDKEIIDLEEGLEMVEEQESDFKEPSLDEPNESLKRKAERYAKKFKVDKNLVFAVIKQESRWNPTARSHVNAIGLMQVMPFNAQGCTSKVLGTKEEKIDWLLKPDNNLYCGVKILKTALIYWDHVYPENREKAIKHALGEYNAGRKAVLNRNAIVAFKETRNYVSTIWRNYNG